MDAPPAIAEDNAQVELGESSEETLSNVRSTPFFELFDGLLRRRESYFETIFQGGLAIDRPLCDRGRRLRD